MADLVVSRPPTRTAEWDYILRVLMGEFLGLDYMVETGPDDVVTIRRRADPAPTLTMPAAFLGIADEHWLRPVSLPNRPLRWWDVGADLPETVRCADLVPVLFPGPVHAPAFQQDASGIRLNADLFGAAFFMLTRYEELVRAERDKHDRFAVRTSLAHEENFLHRPVVNEWIEVIRSCVRRLWPSVRFVRRHYRLLLSHDIDQPWTAQYLPVRRIIRSVGADLLVRREPALACRRTASYLSHNLDADPANSFDWIMDRSEEIGTQSTFYVQTRRGPGPYDASYTVDHPWIARLLERISARGHHIGLHTSYGTFRDVAKTREEAELLKSCCASLGIEEAEWCSRQHYLRWENPTTWRNVEESGLDVDSTLGFADDAGFRCGLCYEYPVFDLLRRQPLRLRERPLIAMEGSLLTYQRLSRDETVRRMAALADTCHRFSGDFVMLWHNNSLVSRRDRTAYRRVLAALPSAN